MSVDAAIAQLETEVAAFKQGSKDQPKDGSAAWFMLRGLSAGLLMLKQMKLHGVANDPSQADRFFNNYTKQLKQPELQE